MEGKGEYSLGYKQEVAIVGWEDTSLMPKNNNIPQHSVNYSKVIRTNRKQFLERRRKYEREDNIENYQLTSPLNKPNPPFRNSTKPAKNTQLSSIHELKRQMANIEKFKDRWEEDCVFGDFNNLRRQRTPNGVHSALIRSNISGESPDLSGMILHELQSGRERRPLSSVRSGSKRSVTLSHRGSDRSQTIHSRCSKRELRGKGKGSGRSKLNITINQLQGSKMRSILSVLKSSI